jgi:hypothetical protein
MQARLMLHPTAFKCRNTTNLFANAHADKGSADEKSIRGRVPSGAADGINVALLGLLGGRLHSCYATLTQPALQSHDCGKFDWNANTLHSDP